MGAFESPDLEIKIVGPEQPEQEWPRAIRNPHRAFVSMLSSLIAAAGMGVGMGMSFPKSNYVYLPDPGMVERQLRHHRSERMGKRAVRRHRHRA